MDAQEIIKFISKFKRTPRQIVLSKCEQDIVFPNTKRFGRHRIGDWEGIEPVLRSHLLSWKTTTSETVAATPRPLLDTKNIKARRAGALDPRPGDDWRQRGHHDGAS